MFERFTPDARTVVVQAQEHARRFPYLAVQRPRVILESYPSQNGWAGL